MPPELLCPECLGRLETADGETARCTLHGGTYRILVSRVAVPAPPAPPPLPAAPPVLLGEAKCSRHPEVPAVQACRKCGSPVCALCALPGPDDSLLCPTCAVQRVRSSVPELPSVRFAGMRCVQHPEVTATAQCQSCGAFVCPTCDFSLPGGLHVCPACAVSPRARLSGKRRGMMIGSFALAVWCTVALVSLYSGAFRGFVRTKEDVQILGLIMLLLLLLPGIVGLALGLSATDRRLGNSPALWIAVTWNGLIVAAFILICVIGTLK